MYQANCASVSSHRGPILALGAWLPISPDESPWPEGPIRAQVGKWTPVNSGASKVAISQKPRIIIACPCAMLLPQIPSSVICIPLYPTGLSPYRQRLHTQKLLSQLWLILQQRSVPQAWEARVEAKLDASGLHCAPNGRQHRHRHRHLSVVWPLECAGLMRFVQPKNVRVVGKQTARMVTLYAAACMHACMFLCGTGQHH